MAQEHTDEEYELISKEILKHIRDENKSLKDELSKTPFHYDGKDQTPDQFVHQLIDIFRKETKKDHEEFLQHILEVKELNKATLDNLLQKNQEQQKKMEELTSHLQELIGSMKDIVELFSQETTTNNQKVIETIKTTLEQQEHTNPAITEINSKLQEVQGFMNNLKTLLAQIKPSQLTANTSTPLSGLPPLKPLK